MRKVQNRQGPELPHHKTDHTCSDWEYAEPGFLEMELLAHEGGLAKGDCCYWSVLRRFVGYARYTRPGCVAIRVICFSDCLESSVTTKTP